MMSKDMRARIIPLLEKITKDHPKLDPRGVFTAVLYERKPAVNESLHALNTSTRPSLEDALAAMLTQLDEDKETYYGTITQYRPVRTLWESR
jgi:hypothetical protein